MVHYSTEYMCLVKGCVAKNLAEINRGIFHAVFKTRGRRRASVTVACTTCYRLRPAPLNYRSRASQKH